MKIFGIYHYRIHDAQLFYPETLKNRRMESEVRTMLAHQDIYSAPELPNREKVVNNLALVLYNEDECELDRSKAVHFCDELLKSSERSTAFPIPKVTSTGTSIPS